MKYDCIIIGGSVAGSVSAYNLGRKGYTCLVLEQCSPDYEKICGGGISYKALDLLVQAGIKVELLFALDSQTISGHIIYKGDDITEKVYKDGKVSLGIQRNLFDGFLRKQAKMRGADFCFEHKVQKVVFDGDKYNVDEYSGDRLIWAMGARMLDGKIPTEQSIGISGQVEGKADLSKDRFYYWYYELGCGSKYFWAFPIGNDLWNVGLWSRQPFPKMRRDYEDCLNRFFSPHLQGKWNYFRKPKAEFLGHHDQRKDHDGYIGAGDFSGMCNPLNGGGIIGAIQSALAITL